MENIKISHHQDDTVGEEILHLVADCVLCGSVKAERTLRKAFQERRLLSCCHLLGREFSEGSLSHQYSAFIGEAFAGIKKELS